MNKTFIRFVFFGLFFFFLQCKKSQYHIEGTFHEIKDIPSDTSIAQMLLPYKKVVDSLMAIEIGYAEAPIEKSKPEGPLNNLICDAILTTVKQKGFSVQASIMNYGGIRNSIPKGKITIGTIYEVYPFENEIVVVCLPKSSLRHFGELILRKRGIPISGFRIRLDTINQNFFIKESEHFSKLDTFCLCTSDYLAEGLDDYDFLKEGKIIPTGVKVRDAIIEYIKHHKHLKPQKDGRCSFVN